MKIQQAQKRIFQFKSQKKWKNWIIYAPLNACWLNLQKKQKAWKFSHSHIWDTPTETGTSRQKKKNLVNKVFQMNVSLFHFNSKSFSLFCGCRYGSSHLNSFEINILVSFSSDCCFHFFFSFWVSFLWFDDGYVVVFFLKNMGREMEDDFLLFFRKIFR